LHYFLMLIPWLAWPTCGHLSLRPNRPQDAINVQTAAMITNFAFFMIRELYCKLRTISGNFLLIQRLTSTVYSVNAAALLKKDPELSSFLPLLEEQQLCRKKATSKLPLWVDKQCLFASVPLEQCTSEAVAKVKASFFSGEKMLSITGGLGVDDCFFSERFSEIISIDNDGCLNELFHINATQLNIKNVLRVTNTAEVLLENDAAEYDIIYADPDRRASGSRKTADASAYAPDIFNLYNKYKTKAKQWLIKLSPMTDIAWFSNAIGEPCTFYLFSHNNEIKEMLAATGAKKQSVLMIEINKQGVHLLSPDQGLPEAEPVDYPVFSEAANTIIKAGLQKTMMENWKLQSASDNSIYMIGNALPPAAFARSFMLKTTLTGSLREMAKQLKSLKIDHAGISSRMFNMKPDEIRRALKLKDGEQFQLFFTSRGDTKYCYVCERLNKIS